MKLSQKDADILSGLYDSSAWTVFRKHFLEQRQMELAQSAAFLPDMDQVLITRGQIIELRYIDSNMAKIRKTQDKRS